LLGLDIFQDDEHGERESKSYPKKVVCKNYDEFVGTFGDTSEFSAVVGNDSGNFYANGKLIVVKLSENLFVDDGVGYEDYIKILKLVFSDTKRKAILFGCKSVMHVLNDLGVKFECGFEDVQLAKYLCDFSAANFDLKALCDYYLYDFDFAAYAVNEFFKKYREMLEEGNMLHLYEDIEKPLLNILYDMETAGVVISCDMLDEMSKRYEQLVNDYKQKIFDLCGCEFNLNSPAQLGQILYEKLGLTAVKKKKTGKFSTSAEVLEKLDGESPVIGYILKYRLYQKLYSTYLEGFKPLIDKKTGLVHTTYNQTTTATGRLSSANPNLQNIPIRENEGRELRKLFVPREGNIFIDADYSQIELRLLAHFSGCKELIDAYEKGIDIHTVTAAQVFD
ncbi:MAG: hypothetical protein K2N52_05520, partial [Clostridia bacterium]|nr:hypothetical protein [Clostridia bacterium]